MLVNKVGLEYLFIHDDGNQTCTRTISPENRLVGGFYPSPTSPVLASFPST